MERDIKAFMAEHARSMEAAKKELPDMARGFGGMFMGIMKAGALTVKEKELIAVAIGVSLRCEPCIILHVKKALESGASRAEVMEAASVAVMMQGGPGYVHLPLVLEALEEFGAGSA